MILARLTSKEVYDLKLAAIVARDEGRRLTMAKGVRQRLEAEGLLDYTLNADGTKTVSLAGCEVYEPASQT